MIFTQIQRQSRLTCGQSLAHCKPDNKMKETSPVYNKKQKISILCIMIFEQKWVPAQFPHALRLFDFNYCITNQKSLYWHKCKVKPCTTKSTFGCLGTVTPPAAHNFELSFQECVSALRHFHFSKQWWQHNG